MSVTAVRGKDWVFNAFWVACGESNAPKCSINIPITSIFRDGKPFKTLGTDESGLVKRIVLEDVPMERTDSERSFRGYSVKTIRALRKLLLEYSLGAGYMQVQEEIGQEPYICNAFYLDGQIEKLTLRTLDTLLRDESWGRQVMIIQGYIPTVSIQTGNFSHQPQVRSKVTSGDNDAADNFTRAIAKYAERAYAVGADALIEQPTRGATAKPITLRVMSMTCKFALDPHDNVIFLYSEYTAVEIENGRKEVEDYMAKEKEGRKVSAAQAVAKELLALLHHAQKRGSTLEASFGHFDVAGNGFIDTDMLIDGLARLGMGVTYPVGEALMEIIGGIGAVFVSVAEFSQFLQAPSDIQVFERASSRAGAGADLGSRHGAGTTPKRPGGTVSALASVSQLSLSPTLQQQHRRGSPSKKKSASAGPAPTKKEQTLQQLLPPQKDSAFNSDFMNLAASQMYDWQALEASQNAPPPSAGNKKQKKGAGKGAAAVAGEEGPLELPLPLSAYSTTAPQGRGGADAQEQQQSVRGLPTWAAKRNQRALKQLSAAQARAEQKSRVSGSSAMLEPRGSLSSSASLLSHGARSGLGGAGAGAGACAGAEGFVDISAIASASSGVRSAEGGQRKRSSTSSISRSPDPRSPKASASQKVAPLSLQGIVQNMSEELVNEADELLHVDHGVIMTYRVLNGLGRQADELKTHEKTDSLRYKSILEMHERNLSKSKAAGATDESKSVALDQAGVGAGAGAGSPGGPGGTDFASASTQREVENALKSAFTVVMVPDLFMTLETLQASFEALLSKYPYAQIVLVGLPGLPNTVWPSNWILNADLHARAIAKLLQHLSATKRLVGKTRLTGDATGGDDETGEGGGGTIDRGAAGHDRIPPLFFMGFGHSTYCLSRFVTLFLPSLPEVRLRTRAVCMVNGLLRYNKKFKQICKDLREAMQTASAIEVNELISSLHFFDDYLASADVGRDGCLEKFWSSRRGLQMERTVQEYAGMGFFGVLEQLKGILLSPEDFDGAQMLLSDIPLLVIQCTEDVFVDPKNAAMFRPEQLPPERTLVTDISDALDPSAVHVSWLKAGHEVVQERTPYLLSYLSQLAQICGIRPVNAPVVVKQAVQDEDDIFDVLDLASRGSHSAHSPGGSVHSASAGGAAGMMEGDEGDMTVEEMLSEEEMREKAHREKEAEREAALAAKEEAKRAAADALAEEERQAELAAQQEEEERIAIKNRKAQDKLNKAKNTLDSKSRDLKQSREHQMELLRQREQAEKETRAEGRECVKMAKEDRRSRFAAEYLIECQIAERSRQLAKARAEELAVYRREEAIKRVEESMARQRAERIEERRMRAQQLVDNIRREELTLAGESEGGYEMPADRSAVQQVIESSHRIMRDLLECRQRSIEALQRQQMVEEKTELFRKQLSTVENDERRLRRAIRLIEINPTIVGAEMNAESQLVDLRQSLAAKQETLEELTALALQREQQLDAANASAQLLKMATQERDKLMQARVDELHQFETDLANQLSHMKMEKEKQIILRDRLRIQVMSHQKRIDTVSKELLRVRAEKGKLIDTDVWVEGVMQRCVTKELKQHLKTELKKAEELRNGVLTQLNTIRVDIFNLLESIAKVKRDLNKMTGVTKVLYRTYKKFNSVSIGQIMENLQQRQLRAENLERRRAKENDIEREFSKAGSNSLVNKVRLKESDIRTKEERQFVGIDLVMNPEAYMHISIVEAEQMQFDEDYHCSLSKTDLDRISKLPEQIALALPFLHTPQEVTAHKLINTFVREKSETFFQNRDFLGEPTGLGGAESVPDDATHSTADEMSFMLSRTAGNAQSAHAMRNAEIMHDILLRESLRDRLRAAGAGDFLTEDEQKWLVMDRVLSPHVYDVTEVDAPVRIRTVDNTLNTSINKKGGAKGALRTEKEQLDGMRERFAQGEDVFGYAWKCPFTRKQLLHIRRAPLDHLKTPEEVYARAQMDKYYVDDKESTLGHSTLKLVEKMATKVAGVVNATDKEAVMELQLLRETHENEPDDETTIKSGMSFTSSANTSAGQSHSHRRRHLPTNEQGKEILEVDVTAAEPIARVWGSWNEVHPASAGKESQISYFQLSTFDASRDHPGCFAQRPVEDLDDEDLSDEETDGAVIARQTGGAADGGRDENDLYTTLFGESAANAGGNKHKNSQANDPFSNVHICDSIADLATSDARKLRGKIILMQQKEPLTLLEVKNESLQARQSRSHYFSLPARESVRALDITVSIVFKGDFAGKGYKLGRLAAGLFRLPPEKPEGKGGGARSVSSLGSAFQAHPEPVGYAPYHLQSPNLPDALGRLVIVHRPRTRPLPAGNYQIVIGAASNTKYSVEVSCTVGRTALPIVDEAVTKARQHQSRLPTCILEIEGIEESIRLAERKLLVCEKMIQEAELESERNQKGMRIISRQLERDDEDMALMEDERRDLMRELGIFEIEYAQWANMYATRSREKDDIKDGIKMMYNFKRDKIKEKMEIKAKLEEGRRDLPACIMILRNTTEAVHVAMSLNTIVQGVTEEATAATMGDFGGIQVSTPAEDVRRTLKQYGMKALSLEEQQWCVLDQSLNPQKYEWMRELEEKERVERENMGKKPKEQKFNPALEDFRLSKVEIEYILDTPFSMLSRKDVIIRKLLTKYHDDRDALQKAISAVAYSFDPHLAERTRGKNPKSYTQEEQRWSTVDRILHPEIWQFYVHRQDNFLDRHEKDAGVANKKHKLKDKVKGKGKGKRTDTDRGGEENAAGGASTGAGAGGGYGDDEQAPARDRTISEELMGELQNRLSTNGGAAATMLQSRGSTRRSATAKSLQNAHHSGPWKCPFDRENILRIWRTPRHFLKTDDEREVYKLLQKYNGAYTSYMDAVAHAKRRQGHFVKEGKHIQWEKLGKLVSKDVDFRARQLLREIDRATYTKNEWISSDVLHANDQKFPTRVLRMHLEEALDVLLTEQIKDRERAEKIRVDSSDSEDAEDAAILLALEEEDDVSLDDSDTGGAGDADVLNKVRKRAQKREKRKRKLKKLNEEKEILKVKKVLARKKTGVALAEVILQNQLGVGGCLACRSKKCQWKPSVDVSVCLSRKKVLDEELERVRSDRDSIIFESDVCLSVQLGGNRVFKRQDLVEELMFEIRELGQRIDLNNIDLELHDAYATRKEYFESKFLHGYALMLWTNNARQALEMRQSRLCALSVSKEVVDDILDWMLEGWYFGERESQFKVLGYVPTIKAKGKIRAGQDQISSVAQVVAKMKTRATNRRNNILTAESTQGLMLEKAYEVEVGSQQTLERLKVARDGNEHEHMLNETETTLKFGIFMMTLMYFRAMTFLKREQKSWAGEGDEIGVKAKGKVDKVMTDERMRMLDEENRAAARKKKVDIVLARCKVGEARRAEREAAERREAILRMQAVVRRQRLEAASISCIQKIYRGHLGRKAARRWALKRAELGAMNALLNATAVAIQRVFRGYEGRLYTIQKRTEMAQFIALMRVQESQQDEEIYWQTHPWSRFKKNRKEWLNQKLEKYRGGGALGGSRLSAEEQAELEGRTLAAIQRQIAGLGGDDDDGEDGGGGDDGVSGEEGDLSTARGLETSRTGDD